MALEATEPDAACAAYRGALEHDPRHCAAYVNLGRLLHQLGRLQESRSVYRDGLDHCGSDATLLYNLAAGQEDLEQPLEAARTYRAALDVALDMADAHFNLARLCASQGLEQEALRHWIVFRKLTKSP